MEFAYDGGGMGMGGAVTLYCDGKEVGKGRVEQTHGDRLLSGRDHRRRLRVGHDGQPATTPRTPAASTERSTGCRSTSARTRRMRTTTSRRTNASAWRWRGSSNGCHRRREPRRWHTHESEQGNRQENRHATTGSPRIQHVDPARDHDAGQGGDAASARWNSTTDGRPRRPPQKVYDFIDLARGVETFLNGIPATSIEGLRLGFIEVGVKSSNQVVIFDQLMDSNPLFLTGNTDTVYASPFFDLKKDGPMVVEVPPKMRARHRRRRLLPLRRWTWALPGPDRGAGGKYLILPPDYRGTARSPIGGKAAEVDGQKYFVAKSPQLCEPGSILRGFLVDGKPDAAIADVQERRQDLSARAGGEPTADGVPQRLRERLQHHPRQQLRVLRRTPRRHRPRAGLVPRPGDCAACFASIGIQKGKPFAPDARMKKILTDAVAIGNATARRHDVPVAATRRPGSTRTANGCDASSAAATNGSAPTRAAAIWTHAPASSTRRRSTRRP